MVYILDGGEDNIKYTNNKIKNFKSEMDKLIRIHNDMNYININNLIDNIINKSYKDNKEMYDYITKEFDKRRIKYSDIQIKNIVERYL